MDGIVAWIMGLLAAIWPGAADDANPRYYGYVEADYAYIAPAHGGTLSEIGVREGETVEAGALLFRLDDKQERAALEAAKARARAARAVLEDRRAGGRPEEIAVITDALERAKADLDLARANFERSVRLRDRAVISEARFDKDKAALAAARARVREIEAQAAVARLPARAGLIAAAQEELRAAEAEIVRNQALLDETTVASVVRARVDRVYFVPGEQAGPAAPVVALLPDGALKVRFFVPQGSRVDFALGDRVMVNCDGCPAPVPAEITYLASKAEFTPPVIYSLEERSRLVFMAEARPDITPGGQATGLMPGQPVDVRRAP